MEGPIKPQYYSHQPPNPTAPPPLPTFTESEMTAAEQLLHLSESSCTAGASGCNSEASASSSTRSVNAPVDDVVEDDEALWRRNKRYRPIADVYASTVQLGVEGAGKKKEKKRKRDERGGY
ncbi:hypothetical protein FCM35_KLT11092 [Carex littledalei]|uniref:Uncharacterized protein n=1 Tax=Carex littledalei TaxID=544730 RepID=A0A833QHM1_9POAL|nr:hypothetical protein FCM35_KLT11092 [Carex littledalei]